MHKIELSKDKKTVMFSLNSPIDNQLIGKSLECLCGRLDDEINEAKEKNDNRDLTTELTKCKRIVDLKTRILDGVPGLVKLSKKDIYDLKNSMNIYHEKEGIKEEDKEVLEHYLVDLDPLIDQMK